MSNRLYSGSEKPAVGDTVRVWTTEGGHGWPVGSVTTVRQLDRWGDPLVELDPAASFAYGGCRFELIARAGEAVTFRPGDVVESIRDPYAPNSPGRKGERLTVIEVLPIYMRFEGENRQLADKGRFKLVHRPDPVKQGYPVEPPFGCSSLRAVPQEGDLIEVTFKGRARISPTTDILRVPAGNGVLVDVRTSDSVKIIEPRPLVVGDRVIHKFHGGPRSGEIIGLDGDSAWVRVNPAHRYISPVSNLERVQ